MFSERVKVLVEPSMVDGEVRGRRVQIHVGPMSAGGEVVRTVEGVGAEALFWPGHWRFAVSAHALGYAGGVGASLDPVRWVDWQQWAKNRDNVAKARAVGAWFHRGYLGWAWWVPPFPMGFLTRNTRRRGYATLARVLLGERRSKVESVREVPVAIDLPEGTYRGTATVTITRETRERASWWAKRETEVELSFPQGIAVPAEAGAISWEDPYDWAGRGESRRRSFRLVTTRVNAAAQAFVEQILKARGDSASATWRPAQRFRRMPSAYAGKPTPQPSEMVQWERRDPLTGEWRPGEACRRGALPERAIVHPHERAGFGGMGTSAKLMVGLLGIGIGPMVYGLLNNHDRQ